MKPIAFLLVLSLLIALVGGCTAADNGKPITTRSTGTTTTAKEDNPALWSPVYVDVDCEVYTITDAAIVFIDGKHYNSGKTFGEFGHHKLKYTKYNNDYTRDLYFYRAGDVNGDQLVDAADVTALKTQLNGTPDALTTCAGDLNKDGKLDSTDLSLLTQATSLKSGLLLLSPVDGIPLMKPSAAVAEVVKDYTPASTTSMLIKDGTQMFHRAPLVLTWASGEAVDTYTVTLSLKEDLSDPLVYTSDRTGLVVYNLIPDTAYYWQVAAGDVKSAVGRFVTADTVRTLTIDGVDNARDVGGYAVGDNRIRYGMVYRTASLDAITAAGQREMIDVLKVRTDLDLRTPGEGTASDGNGSPIGSDVQYINCDAPYYYGVAHGLAASDYMDALRAEIRTFVEPSNFPIVVHCSVGRDRTGTLMMLILGLCGVSETDVYLDYELSVLSEIGGKNASVPSLRSNLTRTMQYVKEFAPDGDFQAACEAYLLSLGITADEITAIKENMIEK